MKAFVALFALAAVAAAESDPLLYAANPLWGGIGYTGYNAGLLGYGLPWAAGVYGHNAAGLPALKASRCVNAAGIPQPCADGLHKREAESDPLLYTASPYLGYTGLTGYTGYNAGLLGYGLPAYTTAAVATGYAGFNAAGVPALKASPCTNAAGIPQACAHGIYKREAESDPLLYTASPYLGYAGLTGYNAGLLGSTLPYGLPAALPAAVGYKGFDPLGRPEIRPFPCRNAKGEAVSC